MSYSSKKELEIINHINKNYLGEEEVPGPNSNKVILSWIKLFLPDSTDDSNIAWCSIFVASVLTELGVDCKKYIAARKWLNHGTKLDYPRYGCLCILYRGKKDGWKGHVGFFIRETKSHVLLLGGNQSDKVRYSWYSKSKLLGYRGIS